MYKIENLFSVRGKRCLVTGAATGIGAAIAEALVVNGAYVAGTINKSLPGWLPNVEGREDGIGEFVHIPCDLMDQAHVETLPAKAEEALGGPIQVLVHAAHPALPREKRGTIEDMRNNIKMLECAMILYPAIAKVASKNNPINSDSYAGGGGSIITISSIWGARAFPWNDGYTIVKHSLCGYTKAVAFEYGQQGVRANNILPGYTKTRATQSSWSDPDIAAHRAGKSMLGRWGLPAEMAGAALFLASDASSFVTGLDLFVDGGWTAKGG